MSPDKDIASPTYFDDNVGKATPKNCKAARCRGADLDIKVRVEPPSGTSRIVIG